MSEYKKGSQRFTAEVDPCPHCGNGHPVDFMPFYIGEYMECSHWGMCPNLLDPIPVRVMKGAPDDEEGYDYGQVIDVHRDEDLNE